jgi:hypothetical protein
MPGAIGGHRGINREWRYAAMTELRMRRSRFASDRFKVGDDRNANAEAALDAGNSTAESL